MTRNDQDERLPDGDDGHTIADMNIEGMPWYRPERPGFSSGAPSSGEGLTPRQMRTYTWGALKAAMLVTLVMCLGIILFVVFCVLIWFR